MPWRIIKQEKKIDNEGWRFVILSRVIGVGLIKKVSFEQKFEGGEGASYNDI